MEAHCVSIGAVQRRIWRLITNPDGVEAAHAAEAAEDSTALDHLVREDRGLSAADRLAVYANAYFTRIHDCLREDHPALASCLGEAAFHDLVRTYLMMHPPSRPSLRHAGAKLAAHLRTEPFAGIFGRRCPWAADLAALEWAILAAFDAPDAAPIGPEALAIVPADAWAALRFELTPSLRILHCAWPVQQIREDCDRGAVPLDVSGLHPGPEPVSICVWRRDARVLYRAMDRVEARALAVLESDETFGALCDRIAAEGEGAQVAETAVALLRAWIHAGLLVGCR
jgi:hypothetical protein